jgi:two-component system sensor histidine kinase YesM
MEGIEAGFSGGRSTSTLMAMCSNLVDEKKLYVGTLYFIIDLDLWLRTIVNHLSVKQNYYMLNEDGDALAGTGAFDTMHRERLVPYLHSMQEGHYLDRASSSVITYTYLPSIQLYLVSQFELASIVGDLNEIRNNLITAVVLLAILFIAVTYLISATVTRPLRLLQLRMNQTAKTNLKVNIPENGYRGEILDLCQSFNSMVADMNELVQRLRLEERQKEAIHFKMLVAQMNPHFLFNTLNTIKWNAVDRNDEVTSAICSSLGSLLETSLNSDIDLIHLKDELDLIHAYLYIQQLRYANRFEVHFNIDEELYYALVPKLSLQPLVENAIIHGFSQTMDGGVIVITARQKNRMMILEVTDNGIGIKEPKPSRSSRRSEGIGIGNLKERLRLLFRDEARLDMVPLDQGTSVSFSFPLLQSQPYDQEKEECHVDRYSR